MLASATLLPLAALALQPADATRASREAYTACLRTYVEASLNGRMALDAFLAAYPQQCLPQQTAYRDAVIRRERAGRSQADAEESATTEIDDARLNFRERFEMALPPAPAAAAPAPAATAPAATAPAATPPATPPAATPAAAPATPPPPQPQ